MDFKTVASQNGVCITQERCHLINDRVSGLLYMQKNKSNKKLIAEENQFSYDGKDYN